MGAPEARVRDGAVRALVAFAQAAAGAAAEGEAAACGGRGRVAEALRALLPRLHALRGQYLPSQMPGLHDLPAPTAQ